MRFNLADAAVQQRDGASGVVSGNVTTAQPGWFVDASAGDLHLTAAAVAAIDRAAVLADKPARSIAFPDPCAAPGLGARVSRTPTGGHSCVPSSGYARRCRSPC